MFFFTNFLLYTTVNDFSNRKRLHSPTVVPNIFVGMEPPICMQYFAFTVMQTRGTKQREQREASFVTLDHLL